MRPAISLIVVAALGCVACSRERDVPHDSAAPATSREASFALAECYRSPASVMGRTTPLTGRTSVAPGWLRFASSPGIAGGVAPASPPDSGMTQLIDADGADFQTQWRRVGRDSVEIRGFNDFMQITLRAAVADSTLEGSGLVTSDADVQRDSAGRLEPLRREWRLTARATACDGIPQVAR
jgi:hypothetical protein